MPSLAVGNGEKNLTGPYICSDGDVDATALATLILVNQLMKSLHNRGILSDMDIITIAHESVFALSSIPVDDDIQKRLAISEAKALLLRLANESIDNA